MLIIITLPSFAKEVINFDKTCDKEASKILYEYQLQEHEMTPQKAYETFGYKLSDVYAVFYDLNSDGINEIIGYINAPYTCCVEGIRLFILKKKDNIYTSLTVVNFYPEKGITVLDSKTDGFYDLKIHLTKLILNKKPNSYIKRIYDSISLVKYNKKWQYYEYFSSD